MDQVIRNAG